ncbi:MAG: O-methyltransferase [Planctomycetota bacterium]
MAEKKNPIGDYLKGLVPQRPPEVEAMEAHAREKGFPIIGPVCGYLCYQIARMIGARSVFELGSGFGYSTYWFARAVQENGGGEVHHTVWEEELSQEARRHLGALGLDGFVRFHVSEAVEALKKTPGPFDVIFCDIDKHGYPQAFGEAKPKLRPGGALIFDNMLWGGRIFDEGDRSKDTEGIRRASDLVMTDPDFIATLIPIRDGMIIAFKRG